MIKYMSVSFICTDIWFLSRYCIIFGLEFNEPFTTLTCTYIPALSQMALLKAIGFKGFGIVYNGLALHFSTIFHMLLVGPYWALSFWYLHNCKIKYSTPPCDVSHIRIIGYRIYSYSGDLVLCDRASFYSLCHQKTIELIIHRWLCSAFLSRLTETLTLSSFIIFIL